MANGFEIAGSVLNAAGAIWLLMDGLRIRYNIRAEAGAKELQGILESVGAGKVLTDKKGNSLDSDEALKLWFASYTLAWNRIGLGLILAGFILDLIGKVI